MINFKLQCLNKKFVFQIRRKRKTIVLRNRLQGFTFIEMIFALLITIVILTSLPLTIKLVSHYKALANENSSIEFEFFHRDLIRDINQHNLKLFMKNNHTLILRNNESSIEYTFKNNKVYKQINGKGNVNLLNQVIVEKIIKSNDNVIKIILKVGNPNYKQIKTLYL